MTLFLLTRIAGRSVAIPVDQVESVVDLDSIVPAPGTPRFVLGLVALRSRLVTVISSRLLLDASVAGLIPRRAVVTVVDGHYYAILVDELEDAARFDATPLPVGLPLSGAWRAVATGVVDGGEEPLLVIDLHALVPHTSAAA